MPAKATLMRTSRGPTSRRSMVVFSNGALADGVAYAVTDFMTSHLPTRRPGIAACEITHAGRPAGMRMRRLRRWGGGGRGERARRRPARPAHARGDRARPVPRRHRVRRGVRPLRRAGRGAGADGRRAHGRPRPATALAARVLPAPRRPVPADGVPGVPRPRRPLVLRPPGGRRCSRARSSSTCPPRSTSARDGWSSQVAAAPDVPAAGRARSDCGCPRLFSMEARLPVQPGPTRAGRPASGPGPPCRCPTTRWCTPARSPTSPTSRPACCPSPDGSQAPGSSLDHAVWFHDSVDMTGWTLSEYRPQVTGHGRGWYNGSLFAEDGRLVASIAQECLFR